MTMKWKMRTMWIMMTVIAALIFAMMVSYDIRPAAPEAYFPAPAFDLTNQDGEPFGTINLVGSPYIIDFIFTRCGAVCPVMTLRMSLLQDEIAEDPDLAGVQLVSVTVDPEYDTPEVLRAFAERYAADTTRWQFLTADDRDAIWPMIEGGFKLPVEETPENEAMPISHSSQLVLVDGQGMIRGYYSGLDAEAGARLMQDLRAVVREAGR